MEQFIDYVGDVITLTDEGIGHILDKHDIPDDMDKIKITLQAPHEVRLDPSRPNTFLYYRRFESTSRGAKFLCVAVKKLPGEAYVKTSFLTNRIRKGELV